MLTFTFRAPDGSGRGPVVLVLVLERENMVRMTAGDPFDLQLIKLAGADPQAARVLNYRRATDLDIIVAYEDPAGIASIKEMYGKGDLAGIMTYLERGRTVYEGEPGNPVKWQ